MDMEAYSREVLKRPGKEKGGSKRDQNVKKEDERGKINFNFNQKDPEEVDEVFTKKTTGTRKKKGANRGMEEEQSNQEEIIHKVITSRRYDIETFVFENCFTKTQESIIEFQRDSIEIIVEDEFDINEDTSVCESIAFLLIG